MQATRRHPGYNASGLQLLLLMDRSSGRRGVEVAPIGALVDRDLVAMPLQRSLFVARVLSGLDKMNGLEYSGPARPRRTSLDWAIAALVNKPNMRKSFARKQKISCPRHFSIS
jgi:hypothetical protein